MAMMRLQRALARAGVSSRRKAEELILSGKVTVNGVVATIGQSVDPLTDRISVAGEAIRAPAAKVWLALHKPLGVLTAASDARGRQTVFDLIRQPVPGLTYVGRLDYLTEGLLLMTNDGDGVHALTHPSAGVERVYHAWVRGNGAAAVQELRRGVELEDGLAQPEAVAATSLGRGVWLLEITLAEGRNREVRRMCEVVGMEVERLVRTRFGPVSLGTLAAGQSRELTRKELVAIEGIIQAKRPQTPR